MRHTIIIFIVLCVVCIVLIFLPNGKYRSTEELSYEAVKALKNNDKEAFFELFDKEVLGTLTPGFCDSLFEQNRWVVSAFEIQEFSSWQKSETRNFQYDSINSLAAIMLPMSLGIAQAPEAVVEIHFNHRSKIDGITSGKMVGPGMAGPEDFPVKKAKLDYSFNELLSIGLFYGPGKNPDKPKTLKLESPYPETVTADFAKFFAALDSSEIIDIKAIAVKGDADINEFKALIFTYNENGKEMTLRVITQDAKELRIVTSVIGNVAYSYTVSDEDKTILIALVSDCIGKYL